MADTIVNKASQQLLTKRSRWWYRWNISIHLTLNFNGSFTEIVQLQQNSGRAPSVSIDLPGKVLWAPGGLTVLGLLLSWQWARATHTQHGQCFGWGSRVSSGSQSFLLGLGAVVARLSILPWHIVLSSTILEKRKTSTDLVNSIITSWKHLKSCAESGW